MEMKKKTNPIKLPTDRQWSISSEKEEKKTIILKFLLDYT